MVYMLTFGYIWDILMVNVTIYSSTMDPMGNGISMRMVASGNPKPLATDCRAADNNDGNERSPSKMEPIYIYIYWWLTYPSKKQKSVGIIIPNIWTKKNVPNHQQDIYIYMAMSQNCVWNVPRCSGRMERRGFITGLVPDRWNVIKYKLYINIYIYVYCIYV